MDDEMKEQLDAALKEALNSGIPPENVIAAFMAAIVLSGPLSAAVSIARKVGIPRDIFIHTVNKVWDHMEKTAGAKATTQEILEKLQKGAT